MSWQAPVVAHVDRLGYMFCVACRPDLSQQAKDASGYPTAIHGDWRFTSIDTCESCKKQLQHVPTSRYVHVS